RGPVAPASVRLRRSQPFREGVRQDGLGVGMGDAIRQIGNGAEAVDRHLVAGRDLGTKAGLPGPVQPAVPEGDDVRKQVIQSGPSLKLLAQAQARSLSLDS